VKGKEEARVLGPRGGGGDQLAQFHGEKKRKNRAREERKERGGKGMK